MIESVKPENTPETGRDKNGKWLPGFCPNPGGRKKNPLKEFSLDEFNSWDDKKKREFLNKISPFDRWRMTEGNPSSDDKLAAEIKIIIASESDETDCSSNSNTEG